MAGWWWRTWSSRSPQVKAWAHTCTHAHTHTRTHARAQTHYILAHTCTSTYTCICTQRGEEEEEEHEFIQANEGALRMTEKNKIISTREHRHACPRFCTIPESAQNAPFPVLESVDPNKQTHFLADHCALTNCRMLLFSFLCAAIGCFSKRVWTTLREVYVEILVLL